MGVIGESGCGKSTMARVISGLTPSFEGEVRLDGKALPPDVKHRDKKDLQRVQLVLQMPDVSFNPKKLVAQALGRPLEFYLSMNGAERDRRVAELLNMVELPADYAGRFPHELSGGEKQRVNLARALAAEPDVILCDEVTSALDTVVGAAIIKLLESLQDRLDTAFVFISHDLSTVASFANRIVVLYAGRVAEQGPTQRILSPPHHPYTRLLLNSVPEMRTGWLEDHRANPGGRAGDGRRGGHRPDRLPLPHPLPAHDPGHLRRARTSGPPARPGAPDRLPRAESTISWRRRSSTPEAGGFPRRGPDREHFPPAASTRDRCLADC